ncbi:MAG: NAD(+) diphosphatase [Gammaproteobacteria bacterium]
MSIDYSSNNVFVDNDFDRWAEKRTNPEWVERRLADSNTRFVGIWKHRCALADQQLHYFDAAQLSQFDLDKAILLGNVDGAACFALDFGDAESPPEPVAHYDYQGLRGIGMTLDESSAALAAYAQAMVFWHRRHQFCGSCGSSTAAQDAGHVLQCTSCKHRSFPRSDPAVIVLAARDDKVLLGRQASWPPGRYSTIAGFVEPGESLEATVRREVTEETGHVATQVRYFSSQPWPFPASLMLGFSATVSAEPVCEPDEELEEVRWFTRQDIIDRETNGTKLVPPPLSIAYRLVEHWFNLDSDVPLADITRP